MCRGTAKTGLKGARAEAAPDSVPSTPPLTDLERAAAAVEEAARLLGRVARQHQAQAPWDRCAREVAQPRMPESEATWDPVYVLRMDVAPPTLQRARLWWSQGPQHVLREPAQVDAATANHGGDGWVPADALHQLFWMGLIMFLLVWCLQV